MKTLPLLAFFVSIFFLNSLSAQSRYKDKQLEYHEIFNEPFNENINHWQVGVSDKMQGVLKNGYYHFEGLEQAWNRVSIPIKIDQSRDFEIETSIRFTKGNDTKANVLWWGGDEEGQGHLFGFETSSFAKYCVGKWRKEADQMAWERGKTIESRRFNKLTVRKIKNKYYYFINERFVKADLFYPFYGNQVGFAVFSPITIEIDYLKISYLGTYSEPFVEIIEPKKPVDDRMIKSTPPILRTNTQPSISQKVEAYIAEKMLAWEAEKVQELNEWKKQGEFEKTNAYYDRMKRLPQKEQEMEIEEMSHRKQMRKEAIAFYHAQHINSIKWQDYSVSRYDPDREYFLISVSDLPSFRLSVPIELAPSFKEDTRDLLFKNPRFLIQNDDWRLQNLEVYHGGMQQSFPFYDVGAFENNLLTSKEIEPYSKPIKSMPLTPDGSYDISTNLPKASLSKPDAFAVVIGNTRYLNTGSVDYAQRDAKLMKRYLVQVLGFREGNIFYLENATKGDFELYFGTKGNPRGKLFNAVKADQSEVFVFYSGHGAPGLKDQKAYFIPVECDPNYIEVAGYGLETFYENLSKIPAKKTTVVLDACFSGTNVFENISPIRVRSKVPETLKNGVVLSSSSAQEVSTWYSAKQHGLFTYFFLKGIHNHNADQNGDKKITVTELYEYISNENDGVPYFARFLNGIEQHPTLEGKDKERVLVDFN